MELYSLCAEMELSHMDEFIDELLREDRACDVILPRIQVRPFFCKEKLIYHHVNYIKEK